MRSLVRALALSCTVAACSDTATEPAPESPPVAFNAGGPPSNCPGKFVLVQNFEPSPKNKVVGPPDPDRNQDGFVCVFGVKAPDEQGEQGLQVVIDNLRPIVPPQVAEIHYDNAGTDVGEAIEIFGPAGMSLTGWTVWLYNGANGLQYDTDALSGIMPATCGESGVVVIQYPTNGLQNGDPDGVALVDPSGAVVEFLSYEGAFTAQDGPAIGLVSTDIGVSEDAATPVGQSLQRNSAGVWSGPATQSFGACN
jgi:hypothetical protein